MNVYISAPSEESKIFLEISERILSFGAALIRSDAESDAPDFGEPTCFLTNLIRDKIASADMFVFIASDNTDHFANSICSTCSYNKNGKCVMLGSSHKLAGKCSFCELECSMAVAQSVPITVVYYDVVNKIKCPSTVRSRGVHITLEELTKDFLRLP